MAGLFPWAKLRIVACRSGTAATRTRALRPVIIVSLELPPSARCGRRVIRRVCPARHQTMSRTSSPAGFVSGHSIACLRIEPKISSTPSMGRGGYDVRRSDGQQGLLGLAGTRRRQMTCRITKSAAKTRLIESDYRRAVAHGVEERKGRRHQCRLPSLLTSPVIGDSTGGCSVAPAPSSPSAGKGYWPTSTAPVACAASLTTSQELAVQRDKSGRGPSPRISCQPPSAPSPRQPRHPAPNGTDQPPTTNLPIPCARPVACLPAARYPQRKAEATVA